MTPTKVASFLLGTAYNAPANLGHGGTPVSAASMAVQFGADLKWWVTFPGSPGTGVVLVQPQVSDDAVNWTNDGGPYVVSPVASTTVSGTYQPPENEIDCRLVLTNTDASVDVTAVVSGTSTTSIG